jgi:hypothetical protein
MFSAFQPKGIVEALKKSGATAKYTKSIQHSLKRDDEAGRVFNDSPTIIHPEDVSEFQAFFKTFKTVEQLQLELAEAKKKDPNAVDPIEKWIKRIAHRGCQELMDGFGFLNWAFVKLIKSENFIECFEESAIQNTVTSYVFTIIMQAQQFSSDLIAQKQEDNEYLYCSRYINSHFSDWTLEILAQTQKKDTRSTAIILQEILEKFEQSLWFRKLLPNAEREYLKKLQTEKPQENTFLFLSQIYKHCVENKMVRLARLIKFYQNRACVLQTPKVTPVKTNPEAEKKQSAQFTEMPTVIENHVPEAVLPEQPKVIEVQTPVVLEALPLTTPAVLALCLSTPEDVKEDDLTILSPTHEACALDQEDEFVLDYPSEDNFERVPSRLQVLASWFMFFKKTESHEVNVVENVQNVQPTKAF